MIGEPLITKDTWESDLARMALTAIRASLSVLYDITATTFDRKCADVASQCREKLITSDAFTLSVRFLLGRGIWRPVSLHCRCY